MTPEALERLKRTAWESTTMYPRDTYAGAWARGADDMIAALRPEIELRTNLGDRACQERDDLDDAIIKVMEMARDAERGVSGNREADLLWAGVLKKITNAHAKRVLGDDWSPHAF